MKNPLSRRLLRELRQDIGKYIALFLFLTLTTGFISGFLVADGSMVRAYDESFEKYDIESGHFTIPFHYFEHKPSAPSIYTRCTILLFRSPG